MNIVKEKSNNFLIEAMLSEFGEKWFRLSVIEQATNMAAFTQDLIQAINNIKKIKSNQK